MRGFLNKYKTRWRGQVYLGESGGRKIRRSKVFNYPHTVEGRRAAETAMRAWVDELTTQHGHGRSGRTVAELLDAWQESRKGSWSLKHRTHTLKWCDAKIIPYISDLPLAKVEPAQLEQLYARCFVVGGDNGRSLSASSVKRVDTILRSA